MTFTDTPDNYSTVNKELIYTVYDANSIDPAKLNYKYVGEVFIGAIKIFTAKVFPRPGGSIGVFDFSTIIREYLLTNYNPTSANILAQQITGVDVQVKIKEEYNGTIGAVVATDSVRTFFNYYDVIDFSAYNDKVISQRPLTIDGFFAQNKLYIPYFSTTTATYNVVIGANTKVITPSANDTIQVLNISPTAINNEYAGTITDATDSYTVIIDGVTYTVKLKCEPLYEQFAVHFLNRFGGFETMLFGKASKVSKEITKKTYGQAATRITDLGIVSTKSGDTFHEQKTTFGVTVQVMMKFSTDFIDDAEYVFLSDLFTSPIVLIDYEGSTYYVNIKETNYEEKKVLIDKLTQIVINLDFGTFFNAQFR
jgi:hypothetical protein